MEAARAFSRRDYQAAAQLRADFWLAATSCYRTLDEHESDPALKVAKPFPRWPFLRSLAALFETGENVVILKSRQMFISWLCVAWAVHRTLWYQGERWLIVSKREKDAFELKSRADTLLRNLPAELSAILDQRESDNKGEIFFEGGSALHFLPASADIGRTFTANGVVLDEFAFAPYAEDMLTSLQPTTAGGGQLIIPSTPNGVGNEYHRIWTDAEARRFRKVQLHWSDHPDRNEEWHRKTVAPLSRRKAAQEYECSFLQSGAVVFEADDLKLYAQPTPDRVAHWNKEARKHRDDCPYLIGIDTAEGLDDGDFSVATVIHKDTGKQVETLAGRWRPDVFVEKLKPLLDKYAGLIGVEKASSGGTVILELERCTEYAQRLYRHREFDQRGKAKSRVGWVTSSKSKPIMIAELEAAIRQGHVQITDEETLAELQVYEYKDSASQHSGAPDGYHDDRVIALAIAYQLRKAASRGLRNVDPPRRGVARRR